MKKCLRKNAQTSLLNIKGAGRPALWDKGIRHTLRPRLKKASSLHLTIKVKKIKAEIKNKAVLNLLKRAISNARKQGLIIIHYTLEYDHINLLIEADNNSTLAKGMQSLGVTLSKGINRLKKLKGAVYKHRYHFRQISSPSELKKVMSYIFNNGLKHKSARSLVNPYNSIRAEINIDLFTKEKIELDLELMALLDRGRVYFRGLRFVNG